MDTVERVARAMCTYNDKCPATCDSCKRWAQTAIAAHLAALSEQGMFVVPAEATEAMLEAAMDITGTRVAPFVAERESGVPVECDISDEDAASINEATHAAHADIWATMIAASPQGEEG
jgi:hypothetical protein